MERIVHVEEDLQVLAARKTLEDREKEMGVCERRLEAFHHLRQDPANINNERRALMMLPAGEQIPAKEELAGICERVNDLREREIPDARRALERERVAGRERILKIHGPEYRKSAAALAQAVLAVAKAGLDEILQREFLVNLLGVPHFRGALCFPAALGDPRQGDSAIYDFLNGAVDLGLLKREEVDALDDK